MPNAKEQLSALPELHYYEIETLPNGETVRHRKMPKFRAYKTCPDDIILFTDSEGAWIVDYHFEGGPHKRRAMF